ncbi:hypothetical protein [Mycolicibacterium sp.]|uniref:hypothetical protein n=1 Tax=Mycolicibacterium sp. TaxID=2320850 RepID=UPI001A26256D|nr:hypothetical protein [Mycolicibacterium sp.]MBJ7337074.1 hypothetical protein [Mycolicibacterium sp.]
MNTVLYFSANGAVYETQAYTKADINELVRNRGLQCLTSTDSQFDFWFSPSPAGCQQRVNRSATEVLLGTTSFSARSVPLFRGAVVVATHDAEGDLDGLSWQQLDLLAQKARSLSARSERTLNKRADQADRRVRRAVEAAGAARSAKAVPARRATPRTPVLH